MGFNLAFKGLK